MGFNMRVPFFKPDPYKEITIYIPSCGRANQLETVYWLSEEAKKKTTILVPENEREEYQRNHKDWKFVGHKIKGIAPLRKMIIENCPTRYCMMLDDDICFYKRPKSGDWHLVYTTPEEFNNVTKTVMARVKAENLAQASVSMREGANHQLADWAYNQRYTRYFLFDTTQLKDVVFGRLQVMEDFDIALQLLRKGKPVAICYLFAQDQKGSNTAGGCSTFRTLKIQEESATKLAELHAPFVKVVKKKTKTAWGGQERTDVMIFWKKAFESARRK